MVQIGVDGTTLQRFFCDVDCNVPEKVAASCCPALEARRFSGVFHMHHKSRYSVDNRLDVFCRRVYRPQQQLPFRCMAATSYPLLSAGHVTHVLKCLTAHTLCVKHASCRHADQLHSSDSGSPVYTTCHSCVFSTDFFLPCCIFVCDDEQKKKKHNAQTSS